MLVLSRKRDEGIKVGALTIIVVEIHENKVRLGLDAPKWMAIDRTECECATPPEYEI